MAGTYTNLIYHLVFSTKNRIPLICGTRSGGLSPTATSLDRCAAAMIPQFARAKSLANKNRVGRMDGAN